MIQKMPEKMSVFKKYELGLEGYSFYAIIK